METEAKEARVTEEKSQGVKRKAKEAKLAAEEIHAKRAAGEEKVEEEKGTVEA